LYFIRGTGIYVQGICSIKCLSEQADPSEIYFHNFFVVSQDFYGFLEISHDTSLFLEISQENKLVPRDFSSPNESIYFKTVSKLADVLKTL
jgi:hypothetical protein